MDDRQKQVVGRLSMAGDHNPSVSALSTVQTARSESRVRPVTTFWRAESLVNDIEPLLRRFWYSSTVREAASSSNRSAARSASGFYVVESMVATVGATGVPFVALEALSSSIFVPLAATAVTALSLAFWPRFYVASEVVARAATTRQLGVWWEVVSLTVDPRVATVVVAALATANALVFEGKMAATLCIVLGE